MISIKNILLLMIGRDVWREEIHRNKNIVASASVKTEQKTLTANRMLSYKKDKVYEIAKGMDLIR